MPTRKITRSPVKVTGTTPDGQQFESTLEEDFLFLTRFNRLVERVETQTITIDWADASGAMRTYTPDIIVYYRKDLEESKDLPTKIFEVKPDFSEKDNERKHLYPPRKEDEEENKLKWAAASRWAALRGWEFEVVRESAIRTPFLNNVKFLLRYLERDLVPQQETEMLEYLSLHGSMTLDDLMKVFAKDIQSRARLLPTCYRLIAKQQIGADLSCTLSMQTVLTPIYAK